MLTKTVLLLALSIASLALPSTNESLEKRESKGWVGSFADGDTECINHIGNRPELGIGGCYDLDPTASRIGR